MNGRNRGTEEQKQSTGCRRDVKPRASQNSTCKTGRWVEAGLIVVVAFLILTSVFTYTASRMGLSVDNVGSGSMSPTFTTGTMIISQQVVPEKLKQNDIIVFRSNTDSETLVCHRIVEIVKGQALAFRTKGDALTTPDDFAVSAANVSGKVILGMPLVGNYTAFLKTDAGLVVCLVIPAAVIIGLCARSLWQEILTMLKRSPVKKQI